MCFRYFAVPVDSRSFPGASHLFEEPEALEAVAACARAWLVEHLGTIVSADTASVGW